jgi:hypothetical protein
MAVRGSPLTLVSANLNNVLSFRGSISSNAVFTFAMNANTSLFSPLNGVTDFKASPLKCTQSCLPRYYLGLRPLRLNQRLNQDRELAWNEQVLTLCCAFSLLGSPLDCLASNSSALLVASRLELNCFTLPVAYRMESNCFTLIVASRLESNCFTLPVASRLESNWVYSEVVQLSDVSTTVILLYVYVTNVVRTRHQCCTYTPHT